MIYRTIYFKLDELVCPDVFDYYYETAWSFLDDKMLKTLDVIREKLNKRITVNNWKSGGEFTQRGLRCLKCQLNVDAFKSGKMYMSPHTRGIAADFDVEGMLAEETRIWIVKNQVFLPFPVRLEKGVAWVHLDCVDTGTGKVLQFNP